jgi:hypothetical protein
VERNVKRGMARRRGVEKGVSVGAGVVAALGNMRDRRGGGEEVVLGERAQRTRTTGT